MYLTGWTTPSRLATLKLESYPAKKQDSRNIAYQVNMSHEVGTVIR